MENLLCVDFDYYFTISIFKGGKNHMNRKSLIISILAILIVISTATIPITAIEQKSITDLQSDTINRQVYLGFASISGSGNNSILEAVAENDLAIGIASESGYADFYINYDMNCNGITDEGIITLTISINGENVTPTIVQTPTSKNGTLKIENIEVHRQDKLTFIINVLYGSLIPLYSNSTSAIGAGVFNKEITVIEKPTSPLIIFLEKHIEMFPILRYLLKL